MASPRSQRLSRRRTALSGLSILLLGIVFQQLLVRNWSDNAYLWIAMVGFGLYPVGIAYLLAGAFPESAVRTGLVYLALGLLWFVGGLGLVLMVMGAIIVLAQPSFYSWASLEFISHTAAAVLLAITLYCVGLRAMR